MNTEKKPFDPNDYLVPLYRPGAFDRFLGFVSWLLIVGGVALILWSVIAGG